MGINLIGYITCRDICRISTEENCSTLTYSRLIIESYLTVTKWIYVHMGRPLGSNLLIYPINIYWLLTFGEDGGVGENSLLPCTTTAKITTQLQNNLSHRIIRKWKSNNQGVKEVTFIQMGRKGGDVEVWRHVTGGPTPMCGRSKLGGYLGSKGSQPHSRPPSSGFQCQEDKSQ